MIDNKKYITVSAEKFEEMQQWELIGMKNEIVLTIHVLSRFHVCGEEAERKTFNLEVAEMQIRNGNGEVSDAINEAVKFNKEQIEELKKQRHQIELDKDKTIQLKKEFYLLCDRNGQNLAKIPKWIRRIFKAV